MGQLAASQLCNFADFVFTILLISGNGWRWDTAEDTYSVFSLSQIIKRATGDWLVSERPNFFGLLRFKKNGYLDFLLYLANEKSYQRSAGVFVIVLLMFNTIKSYLRKSKNKFLSFQVSNLQTYLMKLINTFDKCRGVSKQ